MDTATTKKTHKDLNEGKRKKKSRQVKKQTTKQRGIKKKGA
jgi:hypothetical protein